MSEKCKYMGEDYSGKQNNLCKDSKARSCPWSIQDPSRGTTH